MNKKYFALLSLMILNCVQNSSCYAQSLKAQPQFGSITPAVETWTKKIVSQIMEQQQYPRSAQVRRAEGKVRVRVTVSENGTIAGTEIIEASAFDVLNREAVRTIERAAPFPSPPGGTRIFIVPMIWKLDN
jgi:TonB family protein